MSVWRCYILLRLIVKYARKKKFIPTKMEKMRGEINVYMVCAQYIGGDTGFSYTFYFMTPEPIDTQFSRIINLICSHKKVPFAELSTNYFDVDILEISKVT